MVKVIVIRLHPDKAIPGPLFAGYLSGLTLTAFDLSCGDPKSGTQIGSASYLPPPDPAKPWLPDPASRIVQHFTVPVFPFPPAHEAAATALIEVTVPAGYREYVTADLRVEVASAGALRSSRNLYYDVEVLTLGSLPGPGSYHSLQPAGLFLGLPAPVAPGLAFLELREDGSPPKFQALQDAVTAVLAADQQPVPPARLGTLNPDQARHIAYEIVWGVQDPLPAPPAPPPPGVQGSFDALGALYSDPPNDGTLGNTLEQNRQQFEGNLNSHYATRNAKVDRLGRFVYALSAAVACEELSVAAGSALLEFPVHPGAGGSRTTIGTAQAVLVDASGGGAPLVPPFSVPAQYFYLLGAQLPPQVGAEQRFHMACRDNQERLLPILSAGFEDGTIAPNPALNPAQAARRLSALAPEPLSSGTPHCRLDAALLPLVHDWLAFPDNAGWRAYQPGDDPAGFWAPELAAQPLCYLNLVLCALTGPWQPLVDAILALPVTSVDGLATLTKEQWQELFGDPPDPALLPPFTLPGTPQARLSAFLRRVQKFFDLSAGPSGIPLPGGEAPPLLELPQIDFLAQFVAQYELLTGAPFSFGVGDLDQTQLAAAAGLVFSGDPEAQCWLSQRVQLVHELCRLAGVVSNRTIPPFLTPAFSVAESLYARGFTGAADIAGLTLDQFSDALRGTVAFAEAAAIYTRAGAFAPPAPPPPGPFRPVNPGSLLDCIPPCHLSPLGPVAYLHELLGLSEASNCQSPFAPPPPGRETLGEAVAARRGPLGSLAASTANAQTELPLIDLVNENLEHLAAALPVPPAGAVYDSAAELLGGHALCPPDRGPEADGGAAGCHLPQALFAALPEHSAPAVPTDQPAAYGRLRGDFSSPALPYSQPLDLSRSYLERLGSCRFELLRTFRQEITEFALDPGLPEPVFQSHLWRYPVRIDIAIEYLGITPEEYELLFTRELVDAPTPGHLVLYELYGFEVPDPGGLDWTVPVLSLPEFLGRTGLNYCELVRLQESGCFPFLVEPVGNQGEAAPAGAGSGILPDCPPCCPELYRVRFIEPQEPREALRRLAVFLRLWRKLQGVCGACYGFEELCDICEVLQLFHGSALNPDFIRQLAAFQMLRDRFRLPLAGAPGAPGSHGAERTHLLALWAGGSATWWDWAVGRLLERVQGYARSRHGCRQRGAQFDKLLAVNLDPLSLWAGFDPGRPEDTWHARPASTLRFAEILAKIYASPFGVGEILYLFGADDHLDGDDPFPLQDPNEAKDNPLDLPEDDREHSLKVLRARLLEAEVGEEEACGWSWQRVEAALRQEFGYRVPPGGTDYLLSLGRHCFPSVLEQAGVPVPASARQYRVPLASATPDMWNIPPDGPFRYDPATAELWTQLPLLDAAVVDKLEHLRDLTAAERQAVQDLYFLPRVDLAPFASLFPDLAQAERHLVEEPDEARRWHWFRGRFALAYRRCRMVAEHLARHVAAFSGSPWQAGEVTAWLVLKSLFADENRPLGPWEDDSGVRPPVTWGPLPSGGAFAALLGLAGTGLVGEFRRADGSLAWREVRGPLEAFAPERNRANAPVPTVLPALDLALPPEQLNYVELRNGFAVQAQNGRQLGGAEGFRVTWSGLLLVEEEGKYEFAAGPPKPAGEEEPCQATTAPGWRVTLSRGQKSWTVASRRWPEGRDGAEPCVALRSGAYGITVEFLQPPPDFRGVDDLFPGHTGLELCYAGPDTGGRIEPVPLSRLYRDRQDATLGEGIPLPDGGSAGLFLGLLYTGTLRDARRSYQRAFKALLFARRFELSGHPVPPYRQSELGYLLDHSDLFAGVSYYRHPLPFSRHEANFDFNFLPLKDQYLPPDPARDQRARPSAKRSQALFDWWERIFDYCAMRRDRGGSREHPAWLLFEEALEKQPDHPAQLLRHLGIDLRHAGLVLRYFQGQGTPVYQVSSSDLMDDRWAVRAWHADGWVRRMLHAFLPREVAAARPDLWSADDPGAPVAGETATGNANLARFLRDGLLERAPRSPLDLEGPLYPDGASCPAGEGGAAAGDAAGCCDQPAQPGGTPCRGLGGGYAELQALNDPLRERARRALVAYLTGMNRVPLPWGGSAGCARDLSDLLLIDVETGLCQRASRIEEAASALQAFVQRARLGLEPGFEVSAPFLRLWRRQFESYRVWEKCRCRTLYRENWIEWDEIGKARKVEAFRLLEDELRRNTLTVALPGGLEYWPEALPPAHPALSFLQKRDPSTLRLLDTSREGFGVLGTPERDARPSWLAPDLSPRIIIGQPEGERPSEPIGTPGISLPAGLADPARLPYWILAAIRLGTVFLRVAAAGVPPAAATFRPGEFHPEPGCCSLCDGVHPPLVDEYYFWLVGSALYDPQDQEEYYDPELQIAGPWHDPEALPALLDWRTAPAVRLAWCRVHNGEFRQPRRSDAAVEVIPGSAPDLVFRGRIGDSLSFEVAGGLAPLGYQGADLPGFRYDLAADRCLPLPLLADPAPAPSTNPAGLPAYPYFAFVEPGDRLFPDSPFAPALAVAAVLRCHCRFEAALKWYRLVFDPVAGDNSWVRCQSDNPDFDPTGAAAPPDSSCCDASAVPEDALRRRAVLLEYLETLLEWADSLMRQDARESAQQARLLLDAAARILGDCPRTVHDGEPPRQATVADFVPARPPLNPRLLAVYQKVKDRLALARRCQGSERLPLATGACPAPYWGETPCDCGPLGERCGCGALDEPCCDRDHGCRPHSPYRFGYLVQKAQEAAARVRELGGELLSAFDRGDAEYLASLRARHEEQLSDLTLTVRQDQWREADWQVKALGKGKEVSQTNRRYIKQLIDVNLNNEELNYQSNTNTSTDLRTTATPIEATGEAMRLVPDLFVGFPCEETWLPLGSKLGEMFQTIARITNEFADIAGVNAGLDLTQAGWQRRLDEWVHQVEVLDLEIEQIELQILAAERRRDEALQELNLQQRQLEQSREVLDLLRDQFTSQELYLFLQRETAALHDRMYGLARQLAREAQRACNFELGHQRRNFLGREDWDTLHEGLLAGGRLELALQRMESDYLACTRREYELTKHVSLALHFPLQFLRLKLTGCCEIEIPEWMFDLDYPGHYLRRIRNVSLTVPCVTGPYTGVHCRLTLLQSGTRVDPGLPCPESDCCRELPLNPCGCSHPSHEHYRLRPGDGRAVRQYGAREAIATSSGRNDAGLFELNFRDERHLPFEFYGAVSCWRIELPQENNYFDLDSLTDLVLHLNYTSREGGEPLRRAARAATRRKLPGDGWIYLDLRRDFPDVWELFRRSGLEGEGERHHQRHRGDRDQGRDRGEGRHEERERSMTVQVSRKLFPFLPGDPALRVTRLAVLFETQEPCGHRHPETSQCPCPHPGPPASHLVEITVDHPDLHRGDFDEIELQCVATPASPRLYHGTAGIDLGPLDRCRESHQLTLTFEDLDGQLARAFLLCRYEVVGECGADRRPSPRETEKF